PTSAYLLRRSHPTGSGRPRPATPPAAPVRAPVPDPRLRTPTAPGCPWARSGRPRRRNTGTDPGTNTTPPKHPPRSTPPAPATGQPPQQGRTSAHFVGLGTALPHHRAHLLPVLHQPRAKPLPAIPPPTPEPPRAQQPVGFTLVTCGQRRQ